MNRCSTTLSRGFVPCVAWLCWFGSAGLAASASAPSAAGSLRPCPSAQAAGDFNGDGRPDLAAADFDGDGRTDLAVAHAWTHQVSLLAGRGDGTFRAVGQFRVGQFPRALAAADFDGDGKADLAVANASGDNVSVLLGTSGGPAVTLNPASLNLGEQPVGGTSAP